jgi:hypothetical protein
MPKLVLYGKRRCHLCDEAKDVVTDVLDDLRTQLALRLEVVDIMTDEALFARFRYDVPVLCIDGVPAFRHRVEAERLLERLVSGTPTSLEAAGLEEERA